MAVEQASGVATTKTVYAMSRPLRIYSAKLFSGIVSGLTRPPIRTASKISDPKRAPILKNKSATAAIYCVKGLYSGSFLSADARLARSLPFSVFLPTAMTRALPSPPVHTDPARMKGSGLG